MTCALFIPVVLIILIAWLIRFLVGSKIDPVFNIYRGQGRFYFLKYYVMVTLLRLRKVKLNLAQNQHSTENNKEQLYAILDRPQPLSSSIHAIDAVYFNGANSKSSWIVCGTARRKNNLVNGFLYLKVSELSESLLVSPRLPDTCMRQLDSELGRYEVEGLKLVPIIPMKKWKLEYQGTMRLENDHSQNFNVKLEAFWKTDMPYFNFASDMDPIPVARAMAKELWSKNHFKNLKKYHQTHYEHFGIIEGKVQIDDQTYSLSLDCMRDHSFGDQRNWKNFHRYVMHFVHLENGDRITVGVICMPITFSRLEVGFMSKSKECLNFPITAVEFNLYQHGEQGRPPIDYALQFTADGQRYTMKVRALLCPEFYIGEESECRIVEQMCTFEVNGLKGWGAAEWQYRHFGNLPE